MIIKRFIIQNFGKIHDQTFTLSPGINVLYGENESGKTTIHTFIKSMFYGIRRQRGKAAQNDTYSTYEPWDNPAVYGGSLWFESQGQNFRLSRNFYKSSPFCELLNEDTGKILDVEQGALDELLSNVSEVVYDNTVSVGQLKSVTGQDLVRELQNYMASYQGTGDSSIDMGRASQMLKMSRKGYQTQAERRRRELEQAQGSLSAKIDYLQRELDELNASRERITEKKKALHMDEGENGAGILEAKIRNQYKKCSLLMILTVLFAVVGIGGTAGLTIGFGFLPFGACALVAAAVLCGICRVLQLRAGKELQKRKKLKAKWLTRQEKLKWRWESLSETYSEKNTDYLNLKEEYEELEEKRYTPLAEEQEVEALNLAMKVIEELSGNMNHQVGDRLRKRTGQILSQITEGKYQEVLMDGNLNMMVNTRERAIPLARLSRGTLEQIYFSLRMAAGELLCGQESFPVILDDVFGMYDEERLAAVLRWLHKEHKQIIISTCHKREMELLEREGIPFERLILR